MTLTEINAEMANRFEEVFSTKLLAEEEAEIKRFEIEIANVEKGALDPDDFRKFRLENGIYGIRGAADRHMIRIKIRYGNMNALQLECIADLTEKYAPNQLAHVTTRQAIQLHEIKRTDVPTILRRLMETRLTAREACGNTVRNVSASHYAGISPKEVFDVVPYADLLSLYPYLLISPDECYCCNPLISDNPSSTNHTLIDCIRKDDMLSQLSSFRFDVLDDTFCSHWCHFV